MNRGKIQHKYVRTGDDLISYYAGDGDFSTGILFIHGAAGDSRIFHHQLRHFSDKYRTAALDLQGHGKSGADKLPSKEDYLRAVSAVAEDLGCDRLILAGHSMGGGLALECVIGKLFPVSALLMISAGDRFPVDPLLLDLVVKDMHGFIDLLVSRSFTKKSELIANMAKRALTETTGAIINNDLNICLAMNYSSASTAVDIPALIISNSDDEVLASDISRSLSERIPGARYIEFESRGHLPFFENREEFNSALDQFIADMDLGALSKV